MIQIQDSGFARVSIAWLGFVTPPAPRVMPSVAGMDCRTRSKELGVPSRKGPILPLNSECASLRVTAICGRSASPARVNSFAVKLVPSSLLKKLKNWLRSTRSAESKSGYRNG